MQLIYRNFMRLKRNIQQNISRILSKFNIYSYWTITNEIQITHNKIIFKEKVEFKRLYCDIIKALRGWGKWNFKSRLLYLVYMDYEIYFKAFELQNINIGKTFFLNKNFWIKTKFTDELKEGSSAFFATN